MKSVALQPRYLISTAAVIVAAMSMGVSPSGQQTPFKSGANTVAVYATVTDSTGRLVPNLTKDDFEVYDNGKIQPITLFANEIQPITIVVMLDRSGSMKTNFHLVENAAKIFIRKLLPADKARIGTFATKIQIDPEEFTSNQDELLDVLRSDLQPDGPTPLWNAVDKAMTALRGEQGRRVVLVFTDGVDSPMNFSFKNVSLMDVMDRGQREDMMVYAIGLESVVPWGNRQAPLPGVGMGGMRGMRGPMIAQKPDAGLPTIAAETGGGYFELTRADDLVQTFTRVADELHQQYAIGFEPSKLDGKRHKLQLKVKQQGMTARARKNYIAPSAAGTR
jgi:Ca-activated chloride channel family protein